MRCISIRLALPVVFLLALTTAAQAQSSSPESQIKAVLETQVAAWNRGDLATFLTTYAPDCIFVGKQVAHGLDQLRARYEKTYPTRDAMGRVTFRSLDVHLLTADVAVVTGEWHLDRASNPVGGLFSLVFHRQAGRWLIALDHTS